MAKRLLFSVTKEDFVVEDMRAGGPGGQHQNKVSSAIRITHPASGAVGVSRSERSQYINKKLAFQHMIASSKFQTWLKLEIARRLVGKSIDEIVDDQMRPVYIYTEVQDGSGKWVSECLASS